MGTGRRNSERGGLILLFTLLALLPLALVGLGPDGGVAHGQVPDARVTGHGRAGFPPAPGQDPVSGCRFAVDAFRSATGAGGSFTCDLLPQSVSLGLPFTRIQVEVNGLEVPAPDEATVEGSAVVDLPDGGSMQGVPATVRLHAGGPGAGAIRIDLTGVFDGLPGDQTPGDGDYSLIPQEVTEGSIVVEESVPGPSPSPSASPTVSPSPAPSPTASSSPSPRPTPSSSRSPQPGPPGGPDPGSTPPSSPPAGDIPFTLGGTHSTARLMAILSQLSPGGTPRFDDILAVVGPFPVAGLAWWQSDWHAYRCCPFPHLHQGLDMFAPRGTPVVAAADGVISQKFHGPISGLAVEITDSSSTTQYFYAHLSAFGPGIEVGTTVHTGQVVGYVGNTGNASSTSPHLHFEVQPNGVPVPPMPFVDEWLVQSEARAVTLVQQRTGEAFTFPDESTIRLWISRALALAEQRNAAELADEAALRARRHRLPVDLLGLRPSGTLAAFIAGALFIMILFPAVLTGLKDSRRGLGRVPVEPAEERVSGPGLRDVSGRGSAPATTAT